MKILLIMHWDRVVSKISFIYIELLKILNDSDKNKSSFKRTYYFGQFWIDGELLDEKRVKVGSANRGS